MPVLHNVLATVCCNTDEGNNHIPGQEHILPLLIIIGIFLKIKMPIISTVVPAPCTKYYWCG